MQMTSNNIREPDIAAREYREAHYPDLGNRHQAVGTVRLYYAWISDKEFGAVEWRGASAH